MKQLGKKMVPLLSKAAAIERAERDMAKARAHEMESNKAIRQAGGCLHQSDQSALERQHLQKLRLERQHLEGKLFSSAGGHALVQPA